MASAPPPERTPNPVSTAPSGSPTGRGDAGAAALQPPGLGAMPIPAVSFADFSVSSDDRPFSFEFVPNGHSRHGSSTERGVSQTTSPPPPVIFAQGSPDPMQIDQDPRFTFRILHNWNVSPLPSPQPSPRPSPRHVPIPALPSTADIPNDLVIALDQLTVSPGPCDPGALTTPALSSALPIVPTRVTHPPIPPQDTRPQGLPLPVTPPNSGPARPSRKPVPASYDVRDEQAPSHPFFTSAFQTSLKDGVGTAEKAAALIRQLNDLGKSDNALARLSKDAADLCSFSGVETRTIAVLGDSGEGWHFDSRVSTEELTILVSTKAKAVSSTPYSTIPALRRL